SSVAGDNAVVPDLGTVIPISLVYKGESLVNRAGKPDRKRGTRRGASQFGAAVRFLRDPQGLDLRNAGQVLQCRGFELAYPLVADPQHLADLPQGDRLPVKAIPQPDDLPLGLAQVVEGLADRLLLDRRVDLMLEVGALPCRQFAQLGLAALLDRLVETGDDAGGLAQPLQFGDRDAGGLGHLLVRGVAAQLGRQA